MRRTIVLFGVVQSKSRDGASSLFSGWGAAHFLMRLACTGQWPNKPAEIASDEAAMRYRCSWKDLKDMALWTVLTHDACGMVYFVLTYTYALELIANVSRSSSRIRRRHDMVYM